ncbi:MAG: NAD(P)-dependent oxidoreductase [Erysipelotrichaceae bacterium]|nr:NAD(P)-dependent oxidoreductase [Erysipelotrichaceae bacterium]
MNRVIEEDVLKILEEFDLSRFDGTNILITGATGLIGKNISSLFLKYAERSSNPPQVWALVRNKNKAKITFSDFLQDPNLHFINCDIRDFHGNGVHFDHIIHAASITDSKSFITNPVEIIETAYSGTKNLLEIAKEKEVRNLIFLSTMEVYGNQKAESLLSETHSCALDTMEVRSCYPESKRLCESLCASYASEYGVPAKVIRLTQTIGPGVAYEDNRVFVQFGRCAIEKKDIVLHTKGETKRMYLYTADAVRAILAVMFHGKPGEAYNTANDSSYCSIHEMAKTVADDIACGGINVVFDIQDASKFGYAPVLYSKMDVSKLKSLGWTPKHSLQDMYERMIRSFELEKNG